MTYKTVDWKALLGHRVLFSFSNEAFPRVHEAQVLELSPNSEYMRVRYYDAINNGLEGWVSTGGMWYFQDLTGNPFVDFKGERHNDQPT